ncbi:hypothetical protein F5Y18DRAFT_396971 [Xylariaceae sp. FL1019]|nr:hypothetical protein F5Y18DRAFT_396971 [Xylariaceae sp. FL1019]
MADAVGLAIGLAGTALQLVVFSINFVQDAKEVYRHGGTDRNLDLATVSKSMGDATTALENQLQSFTQGEDGELGVDSGEQQLSHLSRRAAQIGRELTERLKTVTFRDKSKWKSLKVVISGMWNAEEIQEIEKRLDAVRDQIQFTILIGLRKKVNDSHNELHEQMLTALEQAAAHRADSKEDSQRIIEMLNQNKTTDETRHQELVDLGTQLMRGIAALSGPVHVSNTAPAQIEDLKGYEEANDAVLSSLWYPSMYDREGSITDAHRKTFQWIYEDPTTAEKPWGNFAEFLRGDAKAYWVTGKPGAGKSTFMKFVNENTRTQTLLEEWAGSSLVMAPFYFYYAGSDQQKSERGLCVSLLHVILTKRHDLIRIAFPDRHRAALHRRDCPEPSLEEARGALKKVLAVDSKFFISIDGLDEFDSNTSYTSVTSLINFTHSLGHHDNVKILLSGRSHPEFEQAYRGLPTLKIHDLTENDIRQYARERLMTHERMCCLAQTGPKETEALLLAIAQASSGVFLWVRLVTDSLLEGLTYGETINELLQRLNALPTNLQDLYMNILSRVKPMYRSETARLLSLVGCAPEIGLLDLWFAEKADTKLPIQTPVKHFTQEQIAERVENIASRVHSRCLGLLEISSPPQAADSRTRGVIIHTLTFNYKGNHQYTTVGFLHRTVQEFLTKEEMQAEFISPFLDSNFSPDLCLLRSAILLLKGYEPGGLAPLLDFACCTSLRAFRLQCQGGASRFKEENMQLLDELDSVMQKYLFTLEEVQVRLLRNRTIGKQRIRTIGKHWSCWVQDSGFSQVPSPIPRDIRHGSMITFAAQEQLACYIESRLERDGRGIISKEGMPVLMYGLKSLELQIEFTVSFEFTVSSLLLENGCDPNEQYEGISVWEWLFSYTPDYETSQEQVQFAKWAGIPTCATPFSFPLILRMVEAGADPNVVMHWHTERSAPTTFPTILLGLRRVHAILSPLVGTGTGIATQLDDKKLSILQKIIDLLVSKGAVEKEWESQEMIKLDPIASQPLHHFEPSQDSLPCQNPRPHPPGLQTRRKLGSMFAWMRSKLSKAAQ